MDLNTESVVYLNIYQNFILCAMKMHGYLRDWGLKANKNAAFLRGRSLSIFNVTMALIFGQIQYRK